MLLNLLLNSVVGFDRYTSPGSVRSPCTGWDTCPDLLTPLALLALKVLLNATRKLKSLVLTYLTLVGNLNKVLVGHLTSYLVGNLKSVM